MAGTTRLELATSAVTGQRSNQLNYVPTSIHRACSSRFCHELRSTHDPISIACHLLSCNRLKILMNLFHLSASRLFQLLRQFVGLRSRGASRSPAFWLTHLIYPSKFGSLVLAKPH